jgi:hypothetical protein
MLCLSSSAGLVFLAGGTVLRGGHGSITAHLCSSITALYVTTAVPPAWCQPVLHWLPATLLEVAAWLNLGHKLNLQPWQQHRVAATARRAGCAELTAAVPKFIAAGQQDIWQAGFLSGLLCGIELMLEMLQYRMACTGSHRNVAVTMAACEMSRLVLTVVCKSIGLTDRNLAGLAQQQAESNVLVMLHPLQHEAGQPGKRFEPP